MKIVVIDGQGGRMGRAIIEELKDSFDNIEIIALGTNSMATTTMLKSKPSGGATGENAILVNCRDAQYIIGPIGIVIADSLHGEISPKMALAVSQSQGKRILLPVDRCNTHIVGTEETSLGKLVKDVVEYIKRDIK